MYILDALYGTIDFSPLVYKCMLSPEVQRLREVRLCNINSLCITGSANTNRFEHSIGTAYLSSININSEAQKHLKLKAKDKEAFVIAALLHDVANGPFGHSYEYIMEKKGFVPEQGLADVLRDDAVSTGVGAHRNASPFETIFFGRLRELHSILNKAQIAMITQIISGCHDLSKLISDSIDLDNIDNVFRMAYHMGISFRREAPITLAESMFLENGAVVFKEEAKPYLEEWYSVRQKVYKFLLLNPQEFAGKYMLTEAMDILFECISQGKAEGRDIKWNYTDYQLMEELNCLKEIWIKRRTLLLDGIDTAAIESILLSSESIETKKNSLKEYLESLTLNVPIKEKGKTGESKKLILSKNYKFTIGENGVSIENRNATFEICNGNLYKVLNIRYNASQIVSRLMTGNLYQCLLILETSDTDKYGTFLDYSQRITLEDELEARMKANKAFSRFILGVHPILDINKTERQLNILFSGHDQPVVIGNVSSKKLLIGVFIKNEPYGLRHTIAFSSKEKDGLIRIIMDFFASYFPNGINAVPLYEESEKYG